MKINKLWLLLLVAAMCAGTSSGSSLSQNGEDKYVNESGDTMTGVLIVSNKTIFGKGCTATGDEACVGGGYANRAAGNLSSVGGGQFNNAMGNSAFVGGGYANSATGEYASVGGGEDNRAAGNLSSVGGGYGNSATGSHATVGGGYGNSAAGIHATIPGGFENEASDFETFAAGSRAHATNAYSFVWSDGTSFSSTKTNQFAAHASGGFRFIGGPIEGDGGAITNLPPRTRYVFGNHTNCYISTDGTNVLFTVE